MWTSTHPRRSRWLLRALQLWSIVCVSCISEFQLSFSLPPRTASLHMKQSGQLPGTMWRIPPGFSFSTETSRTSPELTFDLPSSWLLSYEPYRISKLKDEQRQFRWPKGRGLVKITDITQWRISSKIPCYTRLRSSVAVSYSGIPVIGESSLRVKIKWLILYPIHWLLIIGTLES